MAIEWVETEYTRIACCDCREALAEVRADCVVTDPPYGIALSDNSKGGRHGRRRPAFELEIKGDVDQKIGKEIIAWCDEQRLPTVAFASPELPWPGEWRSYLVWDKGPAVGGGGDVAKCWKQSWEMIQVARNGPLRKSRDSSVIRCWVTPDLSQVHPAAKPLDLMEYLIEQISDEGDTIFDPFMGSGTTAVACIRTGRKFVGCEIDRKYFDIALNRIREAEGAGSLFERKPDSERLLFA